MSAVLERQVYPAENDTLSRLVRKGSIAFTIQPAVRYFIRGSGATGLFEETAKLNEIQKQVGTWSDPDRDAPSVQVITSARKWLQEFHDAANAGTGWKTPHIATTECGEISFEWWSGQRKFSIFFTDNQVEYITAWGYNIDTEMDSGEVASSERFRALWQWLNGRM